MFQQRDESRSQPLSQGSGGSEVDRKQGQPLMRRESSITPYKSAFVPNAEIRGREKIAILGGGDMGTRLARAFIPTADDKRLASQGIASGGGMRGGQQLPQQEQQPLQHEVQTASRHPGKPGELDFVSYQQAVNFGDIIIFAVPFDAIDSVIDHAGGAAAFTGKLVLDCIHPSKFSIHNNPVSLLPSGIHSCGEYLQQQLSSAHVVKFGMMERELITQPRPLESGLFVDHYICGNDAGAKAVAREILVEMGWPRENVIDVGDISFAKTLENMRLISYLFAQKCATFEVGFRMLRPPQVKDEDLDM